MQIECICDYKTNSIFEYHIHIKNNNCLNRYKLNCSWCNYKTNNKLNLMYHCTILCPNKPCIMFEKTARYTFGCQCTIYYDYRRFITAKKRCGCRTGYPCPYCLEAKCPIDIYKHMREKHPEYVQNGYRCCICLKFMIDKLHHIC